MFFILTTHINLSHDVLTNLFETEIKAVVV